MARVLVALALVAAIAACRAPGETTSADEAVAAVVATTEYQRLLRGRADQGLVTRAQLEDLKDDRWQVSAVSGRADRLERLLRFRVDRRSGAVEREDPAAGWVPVAAR